MLAVEEQKASAARDQKLVADTLAEFAAENRPAASTLKPTRSVRPAATVPGTGARVEDGDVDDVWDEPSSTGARVGSRKDKPQTAAEPKPTIPATDDEIVRDGNGFPIIEELAGVKLAASNEARIRAQLADEQKLVDDSVRAMGLNPGSLRPEYIEKLAAQWLVDGKPLDVIEKFEAHVRHAKRLEAALAIATNAVRTAREVGTRRLYNAAQEVLKPTFAEVQLARVAVILKAEAHRKKLTALQAAGFTIGNDFGYPPSHVPTDPLNIASEFKALVDRGLLKDDEVSALPGFRKPGG